MTETETPSETEHANAATQPEAGPATESPVIEATAETPEIPAPAEAIAPEAVQEAAVEAAPDEPEAAEPEAEPVAEPFVETEHNYESAPVNGFEALGLSEPILRAIAEKGYLTPTPIQEQAIPFVLMGRDVLGCAQTGTGKTASFTLPMLDILQGSRARARMPRSLILEPTRELALQVAENFVLYGKHLKLTHALIIGGESMSDQKELLTRGVDVLIATPGRLIDMFERGGMLLTQTSVLVIDEADRMLDMGFIPDVEKIVSLLPSTRQTLFFSATMAPEIRRLADAFLRNPKEITVSKPASVATTITSRLVIVGEEDKREALRRLIRSEDVQNALIFCNRKRDVDVLYKSLSKHGFSVGALHGDLAQSQRFSTLEKFKAGEIRLLCCSDVAARGIDIGGLSHVFNFDVPTHSEDYVHRIGRTGRAGLSGRAFMLATPEDRLAVEGIEKLTGAVIERIQVPGLDQVDWSEGRGKRVRGRPAKGEKRDDKRPARTERPAKIEEKTEEKREPRSDARRARPERAPRPERAERPEQVERTERPRAAGGAEPMPLDAPQPDLPPLPFGERPERSERGERRPDRPRFDRNERGERPAERSERPAERSERPERFDRDARRERYRRDDDLGPSVLGFGDDVPAFMLITARKRPAAEQHAPATPRHRQPATEKPAETPVETVVAEPAAVVEAPAETTAPVGSVESLD